MTGNSGDIPITECRRNFTCRLRLFVVAREPNSMIARENLSVLSRDSLPPDCLVEVLDVGLNFEEALKHRILVTPTLLVETDGSCIRILGNLTDKSAVLVALGMTEEA